MLANAVHLYESVGFKHLPPERVGPSPYARADVHMEMIVDAGTTNGVSIPFQLEAKELPR